MAHIRLTDPRSAAAFFAVLIVSAGIQCVTRAQSGRAESDSRKLQAMVHLKSGESTCADLMRDLSSQTGLDIEPASYLAERKVVVSLDGATARQALDAITELHDWRWRPMEVGRILVERRPPLAHDDPEDVARAMQAALPSDMRTYLRLPDLPKEGRPQLHDLARPGGGRPEVLNLVPQAITELLLARRSALLQERPVYYSKLTDREKETLLFILLFRKYRSTVKALEGSDPFRRVDGRHSFLTVEHDGSGHDTIFLINMLTDPVTGRTTAFGINPFLPHE